MTIDNDDDDASGDSLATPRPFEDEDNLAPSKIVPWREGGMQVRISIFACKGKITPDDRQYT